MALYTVWVACNFDAGDDRIYLVDAENGSAAAAHAQRIYDAHDTVGGKVLFVTQDEPVFVAARGARELPQVVDLRLQPEEAA